MKWKTFYEILNLRNCATEEEVRRAYVEIRDSINNDHLTYFLMSEEDKESIMVQIKLAYQILTDQRSKQLYDEYLIKSRQGFLKMELIDKNKLQHDRMSGRKEVGPGELLRRKREEKGYVLEDVYYATRISVNVLKAMEEMDLEKLPEWIYLRGLLKQYARFLQLDEIRIITMYEATLKKEGK